MKTEKTEWGAFDDEFAHKGIVEIHPPRPGLVERAAGALVSGALRSVGFPVEFLRQMEEPSASSPRKR